MHYLEESLKHEGTWLIWAKNKDMKAIENVWIELVKIISKHENVHIVFYSMLEKNRVYKLLKQENVDMTRIDSILHRYNSEWARDIVPVFVNHNGTLKLIDNNFNGWGKYPHKGDRGLIDKIKKHTKLEVVAQDDFVVEGGAIEKYGSTMLTTWSNLQTRNPHLSKQEIEHRLKKYYGVDEIIFLNGFIDKDDITDCHIDGYTRLYNENTVITCEELLTEEDYLILEKSGKKIHSIPYIGEMSWIYLNYYIINNLVIVPVLGIDNEDKVINFYKKLFPNIETINIRNLYEFGGAIHCITQHQPRV